MPTGYRVVVYDKKISGMFGKGGDAVNYIKEFLWDLEAMAQKLSPVGGPTSGRRRAGGISIKRGHRNSGTLRSGLYGARGSIYNVAKHAGYVHGGTGPRIYGKPLMAVPVLPGSVHYRRGGNKGVSKIGIVRLRSVAGQKANPWLDRAGKVTAVRYAAKRRS
jgi:hypothetical protein